jgi:uncharacterized protein (TIGR02147 family)
MVSVFDFKDYQKFLESYVASLPRNGFGELVKIAKAVNVHPSLITLVLKNKKHLTIEQAFDFCEYAGFIELETDYFLKLVQWARAGTPNLKKKLQLEATALKEKSREVKNRLAQPKEISNEVRAVFYSQWYYSGLRLLTSLPGDQAIESLAGRLKISRFTAVRVLQFLIENNLIIQKDNRFDLGPSRIHIPAEDPLVNRHHMNWRQKAIESLEHMLPDEMHFTGPLSISTSDIPEVRKILLKAVEDIFKIVDPSPSEELACLMID